MKHDHQQPSSEKKLWGGRFSQPMAQFTEEFGASVGYDQRLYRYDIIGSIAHCRMLARQGIIHDVECDMIVSGLENIMLEINSGEFEFQVSLEDVHMNIEKRLIDLIGPVGGKLHTGRSRNDQVALDSRLFLRDAVKEILQRLQQLQTALLEQAEEHRETVMPGYTHLQTAQPVLLAHHLLAYFEMFDRDAQRFDEILSRVNILPLGAGALAGTTFNIDRHWVAQELGFDGVSRNSLDTVSDRDAFIEICSAASLVMMHLSRLSEEFILWSSSEFQFVHLSDGYCTGSSIMPQKRNPDMSELVRGKTGRVYGNLMALLTVMKGLPLAYNKDMQEDKEPLFDTIDTVVGSLRIYAEMIRTATFNHQRMAQAAGAGFSTATDLADYLVRGGLPFRQAHEVVGKMVAHCEREKTDLPDLTLEQMQRFSDVIKEDIFDYITVEKSVAARNSYGGTSHQQVEQQLSAIRQRPEFTPGRSD
ncbi:argininosuccinate lyase [Desulfurispira natronophila]|uniref:Argininosuccinate lyase n=1 Tax=Desulfurispira natronophila TaxID=682562 RepID=A0A7W7Y5A8_9BACT|nr:argininosuccinate lyase [Desulfurispira natronophila]